MPAFSKKTLGIGKKLLAKLLVTEQYCRCATWQPDYMHTCTYYMHTCTYKWSVCVLESGVPSFYIKA
jgi:hypothetical protein